MAQPPDRRSIADRSSGIKQSLLDLLDQARTGEAPVEFQIVEDLLDRFRMWAGNLGALHPAHKRMSLESRLADSPEVRDQICEDLEDMQEAIQDRIDPEASNEDAQHRHSHANEPAYDILRDAEYTYIEEEADFILCMVSECLRALFRIGVLVRKATPRDRFERALQQSEYAFAAQFDINYVEERYPKLASGDLNWLSSRLGNANAKRRQFINYVRDHRAKLEVEDVNPTTDATTIKQSSKATTFIVPANISTSEFFQLPVEVDDDNVSLESASTAFNEETKLRLPSLADLSPDGEIFECPICFTLQSFNTEKSWKIHAYRDLKAYVCTSSDKDCEHKMFGDRDTWFNHELKHHHSLYVCKLCGSQHPATSQLQKHIIDDHGTYSNEEINSVIEHGRLVPSQLKAKDCPFCDDWASILARRRHRTDDRASSSLEETNILVSLTHFKRHVATHQEQLAIFAVPRMTDDDEEGSHAVDDSNSEALSSKDGNSQIADEGAHTGEEQNSYELSSTCVHVSGLPPNVRHAHLVQHFGIERPTLIDKIRLWDGFGFVYFREANDAQRIVEDFNGSDLMGVPITVQFARLTRDTETGEMRVNETSYDDDVDTPSTFVVSYGEDVAFKPKSEDPNYTEEWYLGKVTDVRGEGRSRRYIIRDEDPDIPTSERKEYRMSASGIIFIPAPSTDLPKLEKGKTVLALYPDTTAFYKAEVTGMDASTGNVNLRFVGEEQSGVQQVVERRFVVDFRE